MERSGSGKSSRNGIFLKRIYQVFNGFSTINSTLFSQLVCAIIIVIVLGKCVEGVIFCSWLQMTYMYGYLRTAWILYGL